MAATRVDARWIEDWTTRAARSHGAGGSVTPDLPVEIATTSSPPNDVGKCQAILGSVILLAVERPQCRGRTGRRSPKPARPNVLVINPATVWAGWATSPLQRADLLEAEASAPLDLRVAR